MWVLPALQILGIADSMGIGADSPQYIQQAPEQKKDYSIIIIIVIMLIASFVAYKVLTK